jgi:hypothetical protein
LPLTRSLAGDSSIDRELQPLGLTAKVSGLLPSMLFDGD